MKFPPQVAVLALVSLLAPGAFAQGGSITQEHVIVTLGSGAVGVLGGSPQVRPSVPYSADQEVETTRTLVDGTHIVIRNHWRLYRDSQGRTRIEMFPPDYIQTRDGSQEPTGINIFDPVEGVQYSLSPRNHSGMRNSFSRLTPSAPNSPAPARPLTPPTPKELSPQMKDEDLGMDTIEGVWAHGRRTITTIPVNAEGNDRPIVEVMESWFSEELQVAVLVKRSDPRNGDSIQRLTNIDRSEPDPGLFRPPADYVVTESTR